MISKQHHTLMTLFLSNRPKTDIFPCIFHGITNSIYQPQNCPKTPINNISLSTRAKYHDCISRRPKMPESRFCCRLRHTQIVTASRNYYGTPHKVTACHISLGHPDIIRQPSIITRGISDISADIIVNPRGIALYSRKVDIHEKPAAPGTVTPRFFLKFLGMYMQRYIPPKGALLL